MRDEAGGLRDRLQIPPPVRRQPAWLGGLPRRDLYVLPLLALATLVLLAGISEIGARIYAPAQEHMSCLVTDRTLGFSHGRPHCVETGKIPEGPEVVYSYNACGYRSTAPCGPKPPNTWRIALLGASFGEGYVVPYEQTFGARIERLLSNRCGRKVEVQNLAAYGTNLVGVYHEMGEALALKPDLVLIAIMPFDLEEGLPPDQVKMRLHPIPPRAEEMHRSPILAFAKMAKASRALTIARHFIFSDRDLYIKSYLMSGENTDFLRFPFSKPWQRRLSDFDLLLGEMATKSRAAGVPMALLLAPQRAQAALLTSKELPPGVDPRALSRRLRQIADSHGVQMIDSGQSFARLAHPETLIYTVDGHPGGKAGRVIADAVVDALVGHSRTPFAGCRLAGPAG